MTMQRSLRLSAARRNTLAACLAAALAAASAGAAGPEHRATDPARIQVSSDEALFGRLHATQAKGVRSEKHQVRKPKAFVSQPIH